MITLNILLTAVFYMGFPWLFGWIIFRFCCWVIGKKRTAELQSDIFKLLSDDGCHGEMKKWLDGEKC